MLNNLKHKNSKKMGKEAVRWQILTIAFLSLLIGVFSIAGVAEATNYGISISDAANVTEGTAASFTVTLTPAIAVAGDVVTVDYATDNGSAQSPGDYSSPGGTLTFNTVGQTTQNIPVPTVNDTVVENTENFTVTLSNQSVTPTAGNNAVINTATGSCNILDDGDQFSISVNNSSNTEGSNITFTVMIGTDIDVAVNVTYDASDGTATVADSDYTDTPGSVTFPAGSSSGATQTFTVATTADGNVEDNETFTVTVSSANAAYDGSDGTGTGTITNDDQFSISVNNAMADENLPVQFTVTLNTDIYVDVAIGYDASDGTATVADSDYTDSPGFVAFLAGSVVGSTVTFSVPTIDDTKVEADETFTVTVSSAHAAYDGNDGTGTGTINNNDQFGIGVSSASVAEGTPVTFTVMLNTEIDMPVSVTYDASDGTATVADNDYTDSPGSVTFPANSSLGDTQTFSVATGDDSVVEPDEDFTVLVSSLDPNFDGNNATGTGGILDNDTYTISINNIVVDEADGTAIFTVSLNQSVIPGDSVSVDYAPADGSAKIVDNDYALASDTLTIGAGSNSGTIDVTINNNTDIEGNENFFINLSNPSTIDPTTGAGIGDSQGECVITDNDYTITSTVTAFLDEEIGTILPSGSVVVEHGASQTFNVAAGTDSCIKDVTVDGASQGPITTYTFTNVTSDHTINASFRSLYRITGEIWPLKARTGGAWRAYNTSAGFDSGWLDHLQNVTITDCSLEQVTVEFQAQAGWETPASQTITLKDNVFPDTSLVTVEGTYNPTLTVVSTNGTVTSNPAGIDCGGDCTEIYGANATVQLTAVADGGYVFSEFTGDVTIATSPTNVIMDEPKTITAVFVVQTAGNVDGDGDGWTIDGGDCNDADAQIYPGAPEHCDNTDWDCDGLTNNTTPMDADCEELTLSDVPLESQFQAAPANIVFVLDNSGSMDWTIMTNENNGLFEGKYFIFDNPGDNEYGNSHQLTATQRAKYKSQWNEYNKMYYNPGVEYITWPIGDGTRFPNADLNNPKSRPDGPVNHSLDMDDTFLTIGAVDIKNAHYYTWDDAISNGSVDNGEIYLIVLNGGAISYYQFIDSDGDDIVENGELNSIAVPPPSIVPKNEDDSDRTYTEERQNFVNWYSFYRRRELTAKAAVGEVIDSLKGVQVGLYTINSFNIGVRQPVLKVRVTEKDGDGNIIYEDRSEDLLSFLYGIDSNGGTPLRNSLRDVGRYFDADDNNSGGLGIVAPWYTDGSGECQQAFAIVMTDGYYNGGNPGVGHQDQDQTGTTDPVSAGGDELYADDHDQTLADVAMMFYKNDLADNIDNNVPTNFADDAEYQHMVTYGVSFGVTGNYNPDDYNLDTDSGNNDRDYPEWLDPLDPAANWSEKNRRRIDDLWHATVNGRGIFLSATNPEELVSSLKAIMLNLTSRIGTGASLSINGEELYAGTVMFQGQYSTDGWTGDVLAYTVDTATGEVQKDTPIWRASEKLGQGSDWDDVHWSTGREIATYDPDPLAEEGIAFRWADLTGDLQALLNDNPYTGAVDSDGRGEARLEHLRGNNAEEEQNGGTFRDRFSKLGDIVHSSPLYYDDMIYVGANDGMFHAFDAGTGVEKFAYVPNLVFEKLNGLTLPDAHFRHRYFVDLTPYVKDTGTKVSGNYGKLLVGGLGKGGKGYYCLDVTDASSISESNVTSWVKWEYPKQDSPAVEKDNMGYSFSRAYIVKSNITQGTGHKWVVIFGNGYGSTSETSALYVLDAGTGDLIRMIDTGAGFGNGLSSPVPVDVDGDYRVDYVYAGDLNGNMWKFDLKNSDAANWGSAFGDNDNDNDNVINPAAGETPKPLFKATGREKADVNSNTYTSAITWAQPITTQPIIIRHCDLKKSGYLVLFGTGKYLSETDLDTTDYQTIYGIWDFGDEIGVKVDEYLGEFMRGTPDQLSNPSLLSTTLQQQWVIYWGSNPYNVDQYLRVLTDNELDWETYDLTDIPSVHAGWYFDLPLNKERVMRDPIYRDGRLIIISSIPENNPCSAGGTSIIHELNACTGGRLDTPVFDVNNDGVIDDNDFISIPNPLWGEPGEDQFIIVAPTGIEIGAMVFPPVILIPPNSDEEIKYFVTAGGGVIPVREPADRRGMFYWRRISQ